MYQSLFITSPCLFRLRKALYVNRHSGTHSNWRLPPLSMAREFRSDEEIKQQQRREATARLPQLDREFRQLKENTKHIKNLHVFTVDDYEIDPAGLEWERELRGRSIEDLGQALKQREKPSGLNDVPFEHTDLHSEEELAGFSERSRFVDPAGNSVWMDPMPESDFDITLDNEHFRDMSQASDGINPESERFLEENAMSDKIYASEAEELQAYSRFYDEVEMKGFWEEQQATFQDDTPVPSREKFEKWQSAADQRGGGATVGDSHALYPSKYATDFDVRSEEMRTAAYGSKASLEVPAQHQTLIDAHNDDWTGILCVYDVRRSLSSDEGPKEANQSIGDVNDGHGRNDRNGSDGGRGANGKDRSVNPDEGSKDEDQPIDTEGHGDVENAKSTESTGSASPTEDDFNPQCQLPQPKLLGEALVTSTHIRADKDGTLCWTSKVQSDKVPDSSVTFFPSESADAMSPGRIVFDDGSYVLQDSVNAYVSDDQVQAVTHDTELDEEDEKPNSKKSPRCTLSDESLQAIVSSCDGTFNGEVRKLAELCILDNDRQHRQRVVVCGILGKFTHVISVCEVRGTGDEALTQARNLLSRKATFEAIAGYWKGRGISLHPYFPPLAVSEITSKSKFALLDHPADPREFTYLKEDSSSYKAAMTEKGAPTNQRPREKLSRRVIQALERDLKRLAGCTHGNTDVLNDAMEERHAWEILDEVLYSPRLGPKAPDYVALSLPGGSIVIANVGSWSCGVRGRIELVSGSFPSRKRLLGAKNTEGVITGAALLVEDRSDE